MSTVTITENVSIDESVSALFATIAAGLNGGQFAHLVTNETIRSEAKAIVAPIRDAKRKANNAKRYMAKSEAIRTERAYRAELFRTWNDYTPENAARIEATFNVFSWSPKRAAVRDIARAILNPDSMRAILRTRVTTPEECAELGDNALWQAKVTRKVDSAFSAIVKNWRNVVREYRDAQRCLAVIGHFGISRFDATPSVDSRFYRNVTKHWHAYTGGRHNAIHGVTPDDVFQDGMLRAIEAGDIDDNGIPVFGTMYMHMRNATESAMYTYKRGHNHTAPFTEWTWNNWEEWAKVNSINYAYRTDSKPAELAEWSAYEAARTYQAKVTEWRNAIVAKRELVALSLDDARKGLAQLLNQGYTIGTISSVLGRSVTGIVNGLDANYVLPESTLPTMPIDYAPSDPELETERILSMGTIARIGIRNESRRTTLQGTETMMRVGFGIAPTM